MYADSLSSCFREPTHEPTWFHRRETDFRRDRRLALVNPRGRTGSCVAVCFPFGIRLVVDRFRLVGLGSGRSSEQSWLRACGRLLVDAGAFAVRLREPCVRAARTVRPGATWRVYAVAGCSSQSGGARWRSCLWEAAWRAGERRPPGGPWLSGPVVHLSPAAVHCAFCPRCSAIGLVLGLRRASSSGLRQRGLCNGKISETKFRNSCQFGNCIVVIA